MKKPLRIGLIMHGGYSWLGGIEYIKNIVLALASLPPEVRSTFEVCLLCSNSLQDTLGGISKHLTSIYYLETDLERLTLPNLIRWKIIRTLFGQNDPRLDRFLKKARIDFAYPCFTKGRGGRSYRSAAWIPDCQHKHLTGFFTKDEIQMRDKNFASIANSASVIVFSSKTSEADFSKFFHKPTYKSKILSSRACLSPELYEEDPLETQKAYHLPDRFFFINSQFWQHKNHLVVFKALRILQDQAIYPIIVCTGCMYDYRKPEFLDMILQTINRSGIAHQVHLLGVVTRPDMISLMRCALAVIHPSLFEGWSTVVEEARCLGKPIILSDIPVHREQEPPNSFFFQNDSAEDLATVLAEYWKTLTPGPNPENEAIAKNNNLREVKAFGYHFLEIAKG